jgi:hypothetical protein
MSLAMANLATTKAGAKHELFLNKPASVLALPTLGDAAQIE